MTRMKRVPEPDAASADERATLYGFRRNLVVAASAGTGKTHALVGVLVHLALGGEMMNCGYDPDPNLEYDTPPIAPQVWHAYHIAGEQLATGIADDLGERVAARATEHRQRYPMVGQDGVAEADAGGGRQQSRGGGAHAESVRSEGRDARPSRRCSACETASASSTPT